MFAKTTYSYDVYYLYVQLLLYFLQSVCYETCKNSDVSILLNQRFLTVSTTIAVGLLRPLGSVFWLCG